MFTPEVVVVMSKAVTLAAARGPRFSIPDRSGRLLHDGIPQRRARRVALRGTPTGSAKRVLKMPGDEQPPA
jgi:hypothetical protein